MYLQWSRNTSTWTDIGYDNGNDGWSRSDISVDYDTGVVTVNIASSLISRLAYYLRITSYRSGDITKTLSYQKDTLGGYNFNLSSSLIQYSDYDISGYWTIDLCYADGTISTHNVYAPGGLSKTHVTAVNITSHLSSSSGIGIMSSTSSGYVFENTEGIIGARDAIPVTTTVTDKQFMLLSDFNVDLVFEQDAS